MISGYPKPTIRWYKNKEEIKPTKTLTTDFDGSTVRLKMSTVQLTDSDVYKCVAENDAGRDQVKANITVKGNYYTLILIKRKHITIGKQT